jgi:uncharacterized membrane protein YsdA (DUF1294 family)/cold shock CspA family protein
MRYQGKVTNWKDDQGFGFVTPNGGGQKAFVHINAFKNHSARPINGDLITYELATDEKQRFFAKNIQFAGEHTDSNVFKKQSLFSLYFAIIFFVLLVFTTLLGMVPFALLGVYLFTSIVTFIVYAIDKSAAKNNQWRTQESTLHFLSLVGGWPGALFAQKVLRHKSKKEEFQTAFWATVIANCLALGWLITTKSGMTFLNSTLSLTT